MNERELSILLLLSFTALILMSALWYMAAYGEDERLVGSAKEHALMDEVMGLLEVYYDGKVDREELLVGGLKGAAASLEDPYTIVIPPALSEASTEQIDGKFGGIGVTIRANRDGTLDVTGVVPDGPADTGGIRAGDRIVGAGGTSFVGLDSNGASSLIKGEVGTTVSLMIERDTKDGESTETLDVIVTRAEIRASSVRRVYVMEDGKTGFMWISSFTRETYKEFQEAYAKLKAQGIEQLIVDLRGNGGGVLNQAIEIADAFLQEPGLPLVYVRSASEEKQQRENGRGSDGDYLTRDEVALVALPVVLLVEQDTASASEVLAGALQDHGRAYVIGERTFGKGLVQTNMRLRTDERFRMRITTASYYTPLGNHLVRKADGGPGGIEPDLVVPLTDDQRIELALRQGVQVRLEPVQPEDLVNKRLREAMEAKDPQLGAAIAYLNGERVRISIETAAAAQATDGESE